MVRLHTDSSQSNAMGGDAELKQKSGSLSECYETVLELPKYRLDVNKNDGRNGKVCRDTLLPLSVEVSEKRIRGVPV